MNITIWKGTTMEKAHSRYRALVILFTTRVIYQANMEQKMRMASTEVTVMRTVHSRLMKKPWVLTAFS